MAARGGGTPFATFVGRRRGPSHVSVDPSERVRCFEGKLPGEHLKEQDTERVEVTAAVHGSVGAPVCSGDMYGSVPSMSSGACEIKGWRGIREASPNSLSRTSPSECADEHARGVRSLCTRPARCTYSSADVTAIAIERNRPVSSGLPRTRSSGTPAKSSRTSAGMPSKASSDSGRSTLDRSREPATASSFRRCSTSRGSSADGSNALSTTGRRSERRNALYTVVCASAATISLIMYADSLISHFSR